MIMLIPRLGPKWRWYFLFIVMYSIIWFGATYIFYHLEFSSWGLSPGPRVSPSPNGSSNLMPPHTHTHTRPSITPSSTPRRSISSPSLSPSQSPPRKSQSPSPSSKPRSKIQRPNPSQSFSPSLSPSLRSLRTIQKSSPSSKPRSKIPRTSPSPSLSPSLRSPRTIQKSSPSSKPRRKIPGPSPSPRIMPSPSPSPRLSFSQSLSRSQSQPRTIQSQSPSLKPHSTTLRPNPSPSSSSSLNPRFNLSLSPSLSPQHIIQSPSSSSTPYSNIPTPSLSPSSRPNPSPSPCPSINPSPDAHYSALLQSRADASGFIILVMVDESFFDMAVNLYEFSFRRHGINNFLFVGIGHTVCSLLANMSVPCFTFVDDESSKTASRHGSIEFKRKMHLRTAMIVDALRSNVTVLHTDVDVAFINNPLPELKNLMKTAHFVAKWDHTVMNAGFVVVRPSWLGQLIYETMQLEPCNNTDQQGLNNALRIIKDMPNRQAGMPENSTGNDTRWVGINLETAIVVLDKRRFVCGKDYFENPTFPPNSGIEWNPTDNCSNTPMTRGKFRPCADVVHNNCIIGKSAKVYSFRENLMWSYDPSGTYYGDRNAKYLTYRVDPGSDNRQYINIDAQLAELKTALAFGHLLNRTVILKRFRCKSSPNATAECPLNALLDVSFFDDQFAGRYRESTFLMNDRVPAEVRHGLSAVQKCRTMPTNDEGDRQSDDVMNQNSTTITPQRPTSGDIVRRFSTFQDSVLLFDSFDYAECFPSFDDRSDGKQFKLKMKLGFVRNGYSQYANKRSN